MAIASKSLEKRLCAIEMIVRGEAGRLAYLLAEAMRSRCPRTRERAAEGLHSMTARLMDRLTAGPLVDEIVELDVRAGCLAEALGTAVRFWELHFQPKVIEAALWLGDRTEPAILSKLQEPRTKLAHMLNDLLDRTTDTRLAPFVLRALSVPHLRHAASRAIGRGRDEAFLRAILMESWLLADPSIEQGCRWIRDGRWLRQAVEVVLSLDDSAVAGAVNLLAAIGGPPERKIELFRELIGAGHAEVRSAVVWRLIRDESEAANELLAVVASRPGDSVARMAERELRRRRGMGQPAPVSSAHQATAQGAFNEYWNSFDDLDSPVRGQASDAVRRRCPDLGIVLRTKLTSPEPLDRARGLRITSSLGVQGELEEWVQRMASDPDPTVRSVAVGMLADLPGTATERLLRTAVNDPDSRVSANAIEALDRLDVDSRVKCTEPKLEASDNRVRANAVKSLLRAEVRRAGETLIGMLEDPSPTHRLSALWVIERLRSGAVLDRVRDMSRDDPDERVRERAGRLSSVANPELISYARPSRQGQAKAEESPGRAIG
jgi:hypothetical protein